jgi:Big-like domain-containing protein
VAADVNFEVFKNTPTRVVTTLDADNQPSNDANGQPLKLECLPPGTTQHGKCEVRNEAHDIWYTPNRDYLGPDEMIYFVTDGGTGPDSKSNAGTVKITVVENPNAIAVAAGAGGAAGSLPATGANPMNQFAAGMIAICVGAWCTLAGRRRRDLVVPVPTGRHFG